MKRWICLTAWIMAAALLVGCSTESTRLAVSDPEISDDLPEELRPFVDRVVEAAREMLGDVRNMSVTYDALYVSGDEQAGISFVFSTDESFDRSLGTAYMLDQMERMYLRPMIGLAAAAAAEEGMKSPRLVGVVAIFTSYHVGFIPLGNALQHGRTDILAHSAAAHRDMLTGEERIELTR